MFYTFIVSFWFCLILSFCSPSLFSFICKKLATRVLWNVHIMHSLRKALFPWNTAKKNYFAFAVSWHNQPTCWVEWILANQRYGTPGGTCHRLWWWPAQRPSVSTFLLAPNWGLGIKSPFPCCLTGFPQGSTYSQALNVTCKWTTPKSIPWPNSELSPCLLSTPLWTCAAVIRLPAVDQSRDIPSLSPKLWTLNVSYGI